MIAVFSCDSNELTFEPEWLSNALVAQILCAMENLLKMVERSALILETPITVLIASKSPKSLALA